jgi:hypothetical protein
MKTLKRAAAPILITLLCFTISYGQNYTVTTSLNNTYTPLEHPTLITNQWDQNLFLSQDIGVSLKFADLNFYFNGQNGMFMFGAGVLAADAPSDSVAIDFDGLFVPGLISKTGSAMNYEINGTAPNRIIKFEWKNAGLINADTGNFVNFQMWMYESMSFS